jgi:hypothetical protein
MKMFPIFLHIRDLLKLDIEKEMRCRSFLAKKGRKEGGEENLYKSFFKG